MVRALIALALWSCASAHAFDLQGHRGTRGLAPENTLVAFQRALALGVTTLETDLAVTRDGVLVISHDPVLNPDLVRGPDGKWLTEQRTAHPLAHARTAANATTSAARIPRAPTASNTPSSSLRTGSASPRSRKCSRWAPANKVRFAIETKITPASGSDTPDPATFAKLVVDAIREAGMTGRVEVLSFDWRTLVEVKKLAPEIRTVCITQSTPNFDNATNSTWTAGLELSRHDGSVPKLVRAAGCNTWSSFFRNLTPATIAEGQSLGLTVLPWTVNDPADMARLIDWKVDGLITDYPDRARKVMADKGLPLP